jgi:fructose-bisphosphate aldolase class II
MKPAREAMQKVVALRMTQFGQAGHAGDYAPIAIAEIAKGYADGTLATQPLVAAK